jgi:pimeloyl-ACP methyl ester carboxylesterase
MQIEIAGCQTRLETSGNPDGPLVILLHGSGSKGSVWAYQLQGLADDDWWLLAPDLPGHGQSQGDPLGDISSLADWTAKLLAGAGREQATVVGHSMGALVAIELAARHPKLTNRIVLVGAVPRMAVNPDLLALAKVDDPQAFRLVASWSCCKGEESAEIRRVTEQRLLQNAPGVLWTDLNACDSYVDLDAAAENVTCPVAVISGAEDRMTPASAGRELAARFPGGEHHAVASAGHEVMQEQPAKFNRILRGLLP